MNAPIIVSAVPNLDDGIIINTYIDSKTKSINTNGISIEYILKSCNLKFLLGLQESAIYSQRITYFFTIKDIERAIRDTRIEKELAKR